MSGERAVTIFGLGGTIASVPSDGVGAAPLLGADEIVSAVPELAAVASITCVAFRKLPGAHLRIADLIELAAAIEQSHSSGADGVVVMQGTDTIEETAFALNLLVRTAGAVIVTGAMRHPAMPGADGPANILAAVKVAASDGFREAGAVVVLNDVIHAAAWVRKSHTSAPSAFDSPMTGPMGWIAEGRVYSAWTPRRWPGVAVDSLRRKPASVALLTTWLGDDGRLVSAATSADFDGLVIAGLGGGHVSVGVADALGLAAKQMPVVLASRTGAGEVLRDTYGFVGSEIDLIKRGLIPAGVLDGVKARLLLELLLTRIDCNPATVAGDFKGFASGWEL